MIFLPEALSRSVASNRLLTSTSRLLNRVSQRPYDSGSHSLEPQLVQYLSLELIFGAQQRVGLNPMTQPHEFRQRIVGNGRVSRRTLSGTSRGWPRLRAQGTTGLLAPCAFFTCHGCLPRLHYLVEFHLAIAEPLSRPNPMESPSLVFKNLLTQSVAITSRRGRAVARSVGLNRQNHPPGLVWMRTGKVDSISGDIKLSRNGNSSLVQTFLYGEIEGVQRHVTGFCAHFLTARGGELEVLAQEIDSFVASLRPGAMS